MLVLVLFAAFLILPSFAVDITKSDLQTLDSLIDGDIEFPDDSAECLESDYMVFTAYTCPNQNSFAVILVENANDIRLTLNYISNFDTEFRVKSSGNSFAGLSKCDECLTINLERMTRIEYKLGSEIDSDLIENNIYLEIESGVRMIDIARSFSDATINRFYDANNTVNNVRILHCDGGKVAAGGFYPSGGRGQTVTHEGYASDYIVGVEIVLHDGQIKTFFEKETDAEKDKCKHNKDLLWAIRGSGAGSFGIVTKFYMKTLALPDPNHVLIVYIKYALMDAAQGKSLLKLCQYFAQNTDNAFFHIGCSVAVGDPDVEAPKAYYIQYQVRYTGADTDAAAEIITDILVNEHVTKIQWRYPPNEYTKRNYVASGTEERPGVISSRLFYSFDELTDEFYDAFINFFVETIGLLGDLLIRYGVGARALWYIWGENSGVYNNDPENCLTSAPNRNAIGQLAIITGTVDPSIFMYFKDSKVIPLLQQGISDVFDPFFGDQVFIGYRDPISTDLSSYFGADIFNNQQILHRLKQIKCKYDPYDVFHHQLSIPIDETVCNPDSPDSPDNAPAAQADKKTNQFGMKNNLAQGTTISIFSVISIAAMIMISLIIYAIYYHFKKKNKILLRELNELNQVQATIPTGATAKEEFVIVPGEKGSMDSV